MIKRIINKLGIYKTYSRSIGNTAFKIPVHKGIGFSNLNDAEPWMTDLLQLLGSLETNFLDVGVNTGQTLLKWKALFPTSNYTGFEPNMNCVNYVNKLIKENKLDNCSIHPYGLSTSAESTKLFLLGNDPADSSATTIEGFRENEDRKEIEIQTIPLKEVTTEVFNLIKIDVEGSELEVIQSIFEVQKDAVIICEILPVYKAENTKRLQRQQEIEKILKEHNYSIFRILKKDKISLEQIESFDIHGDLDKSDYVFIPEEKINSILAKFK